MITGTSTTPAVRDFAAAVRDALGDLPVEEIDDLTDGLEADLSEQVVDTGINELGDPHEYADELRAAAGLPAREESNPAASRAQQFAATISNSLEDFRRGIRRNPASSAALDFAIALRPLWWVARGWLGYSYLAWAGIVNPAGNNGPFGFYAIVPSTVPGWIITLLFVVVSVQWGRGRWLAWTWLRWARIAASILAVLAVPGALLAVGTGLGNNTSSDEGTSYPTLDGIVLNGAPVSNIFAYDANGNPLTDVRLYDQDGLPLTTSGDDSLTFSYVSASEGTMSVLVPGAASQGDSGWNIYPLRQVSESVADNYDQTAPLPDTVQATSSLPPFFTLAPLPSQTAATAGGASAAPQATPMETPTATPTPLSPARPTATPTPTRSR